MTKEILEKTAVLFKQIESLQTDEEKLPLRTEIYKLNYRIVQNEMLKRSNYYGANFPQFRDDMHGAITEALWEAICKYDASKKANLYTYATPYINSACQAVVRSHVTKDTMSEYDYRKYCKMHNYMEQGMTRQELVETGEFGKTSRAVDRMYLMVSGNAFPMENADVALVSCTYRENGFDSFERQEYFKQLGTVCQTEQEKWMFERFVETGRSDIDWEMAREFHITRQTAQKKLLSFRSKLRHMVKSDGSIPEAKADVIFISDKTNKSASPKCSESSVIDLDDIGKGGNSMKPEQCYKVVPKEARLETAEMKLDTSIDLGIRQFIDERVREKIDEMSVDDIANYVVVSLKKQQG